MTAPVPEQAIDAALGAYLGAYIRSETSSLAPDVIETVKRALGPAYRPHLTRALEAAAPAIRDAERQRHLAERDLMLADLGDLLEATGLGNHARPEPPHDVMRQAIARAREHADRIAELEQLAPEILAAYLEVIGCDRPEDVAADIARWEATLAGAQ